MSDFGIRDNTGSGGDGAELIDGALTNTITAQWSAAHFKSNGTAWYIL